MNKIRHLLFAITFLLISSSLVLASFDDYSGGARMRSMAGAYSAIANDSDSVFIQPAGIMGMKTPELSLSYGRLFVGLTDESKISDNQASLGIPISGYAALGFGYKSLYLDSMYKEETVIANTAFSGGKNVDFGFSVKFLSVKYGSDLYTAIDPVFANASSKRASDFDFGVIYRPFSKLNIAYAKSNITGADIGISEKALVSSRDHFGVSYKEDSFAIILETVMKDGKSEFIIGTEKGLIKDMIHLRTGINSLNGSFGKFTMGFGITFKDFKLSYAWDQPLRGIEGTSGTHYLSFGTSIGKLNKKPQANENKKPTAESRTEKPAEKRIKEINKTGIIQPKTTEAVIEEPSFPFDEDLKKEFMKRILGEEKANEIILGEELKSKELKEQSADALEKPEKIQLDKNDILKFIGTKDTAEQGISAPKSLELNKEGMILPLIQPPSLKPVQNAEDKKAAVSPKRKERRIPRPAARTHKVKDGDTLPGLAVKYYKDRSKWTKIYEANIEKTEKGTLKTGTVLIIP